eukprot:CAMPEP_0174264658 /NCGR_PEP_ID=MMETSP0439-20130205/23345_1 /TAXON_ID=0 /ORGANISM="Stereomyxa ramosa, Strain Chinc5" /LENGTH=276 /DNA_ID=CAMNT_0015350659 /DNA_START=46 /DNA_END=876 /DNA_ORIENTATION=+
MKTLETLEIYKDEEATTLAIIRFNRPHRSNSFIPQLHFDLQQALKELNLDDSVSAVLLTSTGKYYSSGLDLGTGATMSSMMGKEPEEVRRELKQMIWTQAHATVDALISFEKPIIAAVNGPAMGFGMTSLGLVDIIYCSDTATFNTPFMQLAVCAEGLSSVLFPSIFGPSKANEILLMGKKITAEEALKCGWVSEVYPKHLLLQHALTKARTVASFPVNALKQTKALIMHPQRKQMLRETNDRELTLLVERFMSEECINAMMQFMMNRAQNSKAKL